MSMLKEALDLIFNVLEIDVNIFKQNENPDFKSIFNLINVIIHF